MKKRLTVLAVAVALALAVFFAAGLMRRANAGGPSCKGKCNRALNACLATASTSEAAQCKESYQGCISSCK